MRIYKTRADFTKLHAAQNPNVFDGTVCTITDEAANPMYVFQNNVWNTIVSGYIDPVTGSIATIYTLTQAMYDAIPVKDASTLYVIVP